MTKHDIEVLFGTGRYRGAQPDADSLLTRNCRKCFPARRNSRPVFFRTALLLVTVSCCTVSIAADKARSEPPPPPASTQDLEQSIRSAADYLSRATLPNGEFIYLANPDPRFKSRVEYHVVRHAAVLYVFSEYLRGFDDPAAADAWVRAGGFLNQCCVTTVPGHADQLAVWSLPQLHQSDKPLAADVGGTGLALVGMVGLETRHPGSVDREGLRAFGRFLLSMQDEDGSFKGKYVPAEGGARNLKHALFYPGEAILGLLALYEIDPAPQWLQAAGKGVAWLFENQTAEVNKLPADHWTLLAAGKLMAVTQGKDLPFDRPYFNKHIARISAALLDDYVPHADPRLRGSAHEKGYTTPTATRLEGLLATVDLLPESDAALRNRILVFARDGVAFLMRAQLKTGPFAGGVPAAITLPAKTGSIETQGWASEVRIDYVQHALAAMLAYQQRVAQKNKAP